MTEAEYYQQTLLAIALERATVAAGDRKLTYSAGGRSFSWTQYLEYLDDAAKKARENLIAAEGPSEFYVTGTS